MPKNTAAKGLDDWIGPTQNALKRGVRLNLMNMGAAAGALP
jgi:hypothetical protein